MYSWLYARTLSVILVYKVVYYFLHVLVASFWEVVKIKLSMVLCIALWKLIMLREINGRFHRTFMFYYFVWSTRLNFTSTRHLNDWQLYLSYLIHWIMVHGRSELVGYPVWLIPVTSEIPTRLGVYNAKAFKRIQVGTYTYMSEDWD